ncbi:MAG TPA: hypothetical protein V6C69_07075 [Trichormus sp.]|jgi:uncharacterized membrane protein
MKNMLEMTKEGWQPFTKHLSLTLTVPAVLTIVPMVVVGIPALIVMILILGVEFMHVLGHASSNFAEVAPSMPMIGNGKIPPALIPLGIITCVAFAAVYNAIRVGWTRVMLKLARNEPCTFGEMTTALAWYLKFLATMMMIGLATFVGTLCFVVPGIYIGIRTAMAPFLVVDQNLGPIEALLASNKLVTGYAWQILLYFILYGVVNLIAGFIPLIGSIMLIPIMGFFDLVLARVYVMLKDGTSISDF